MPGLGLAHSATPPCAALSSATPGPVVPRAALPPRSVKPLLAQRLPGRQGRLPRAVVAAASSAGTSGSGAESEAQAQQYDPPPETSASTSGSDDDDENVDEKELLRRQRISDKNKGKTPWNKGRKHSPETIAKIRERTRMAMRRPEVMQKLRSVPHPKHTAETRAKISATVRARNRALREALGEPLSDDEEEEPYVPGVPTARRKKPQKELTPEEAEAARLAAVQKKEEHRRKISEAIKAKWQDPAYRDKITNAMARPDVQQKRVRSQKQALSTARTSLGRQSRRSAEEQRKRDAKLARALEAAARCERALHALHKQVGAFQNDPTMQRQAHEAMQKATEMLAVARRQVALLQGGPPGGGASANTGGGAGPDDGVIDVRLRSPSARPAAAAVEPATRPAAAGGDAPDAGAGAVSGAAAASPHVAGSDSGAQWRDAPAPPPPAAAVQAQAQHPAEGRGPPDPTAEQPAAPLHAEHRNGAAPANGAASAHGAANGAAPVAGAASRTAAANGAAAVAHAGGASAGAWRGGLRAGAAPGTLPAQRAAALANLGRGGGGVNGATAPGAALVNGSARASGVAQGVAAAHGGVGSARLPWAQPGASPAAVPGGAAPLAEQ